MVCPADPLTLTTVCVVSGTGTFEEAFAKLKPLNTSAAPTTETATIPSTRPDFFFETLLTVDMISTFFGAFSGLFLYVLYTLYSSAERVF
jgi:hypothetical protein